MLILHALLERRYEYDTFVHHPEMQILTVLAGVANKYDKGYCFPSQDKILALLARYGRRMGRSSLNRHLSQLVRLGYIERKRRHTTDPVRGQVFRSTIYTLKRRAYRWLIGMAGMMKRALAFESNSRVPNSGQYSYTRRIIPEAHPKSGCAPPGSLSECFAGDPGGMTNKKKDDRLIGHSDPETANRYLGQLKKLLNG